jgi:threonine synthase
VDAQRRLAAEEGLWVQPDSAAAVAALPQLAASGLVAADDLVVCVLTGAGHRDPATPPPEAVAAEQVGFEQLPRRLEKFVGALA